MASFPAEILLKLTGVGRAEAEVKKLEKSLNKVSTAAQNIALGGIKGGTKLATRNIQDYINTLGKLDKRLGGLGRRLGDVAKAFDFGGKTVVGIAGLNALSSALQSLPKWAGGANSALQGFASTLNTITAPINVVTDALQAMGPAGVATAGGIAAATAAAMAFGPAIRKAGKQAEDFRKSFTGNFEVTQDILSEKSLRDALGAAVAEQKKLGAGTREYTQKTEEVLGLQRELTAELRRQQTVLNMVNKEQIDIAKNVQKNINASAATRQASGFADFSQRAGAQTAIDKSIRRQQEKLARRAQSAPGQTGPLMLPSSEMLNAAERGIKRIRSVSDQLGQDLDYTNQEVANFINGLKTGANEAVKLPPIFNKVAQSLDVINKNFDSATAKAKRLAGGAAGGTGSTTPIQGRTAALKQLAALETKLIGEVAATRAKKDLQSYNTRQKRLRYLAAQEKKLAKERAARLESIALGVGFPLLFGGGAGSILGSAAGSFIGSGFGGQIAGGAIGQAIDGAIASIAELGQALNPLTADVDAVLAAAGEAGTELGKLISGMEDTARATAFAADVLASKIGQEGVDNLTKFGEETAELNQKLTILGTAIASLVAGPLSAFIDKINEGLNSPQAQQIQTLDTAKRDFRAGKASPEITALFEERSSLEGSQQERIARRLEIDKEIVAVLRQQNAEREEAIRLAAEASEIDEGKLAAGYATERVLRAQIEAEKLGNDLTKDTVYEAEKKVLLLQYYEELQRIVNQNLDKELEKQEMINAELAYKAKLAGLNTKRDEAFTRGSRSGGSGSGVDKEAQAQKVITAERTKQFDLETKLATIGVSNEQKIAIELERLDQRQALKQKELELNTEDARVVAAKLETLNLETAVLREQLQLQQQRAQLEKQMKALQGEQELAGLQRSLGQELAGLKMLGASEEDALRFEQAQRYANVMADINDQIAQQNLLLSDPTKKEAAQAQIDLLERQRGVYETMLPAIAQAEQQQLKFNQTLSMVQGPVNAFVGGLTAGLQGLIDGTKTAEEAFADMLKGMADALIQTATQMIAQYMAIAIARAIAGMGSTPSSGSATPTPPTTMPDAVALTAAEGAFVTGPTNTIIGETSEPEYVIPASKMDGALSRYSAGARGNAVLAGADSDSGSMGGTAVAEAPISVNINGGVTQMGGTDYIRKDELPSIINQSSKAGEARALRRLRQSPSTRRSVGL